MGAWHLATVLCRLATTHAARLEKEFLKVKARLIENAITKNIPAWTAAEQIAELEARTLQAQALQRETSQARTQEAESQEPAGKGRRWT